MGFNVSITDAVHQLVRWTREDYLVLGRRVTSLNQQKLNNLFGSNARPLRIDLPETEYMEGFLDYQSLGDRESWMSCAARIASWAVFGIPALIVLGIDKLVWAFNPEINKGSLNMEFSRWVEIYYTDGTRPGSAIQSFSRECLIIRKSCVVFSGEPKKIMHFSISPAENIKEREFNVPDLKFSFVMRSPWEKKGFNPQSWYKSNCHDGQKYIPTYFANPGNHLDKTSRLFLEYVIRSTQL